MKLDHNSDTPPGEGAPQCPYHPEVEMKWVKKYYATDNRKNRKLYWQTVCEDCEWQPLSDRVSLSGDGVTSPDIIPFGQEEI